MSLRESIAIIGADSAWAQGYPTQTIRIVVPYAAGGGGDALARVLAELFGEPGWDILLTLFVAFEEDRPPEPSVLAARLGLRAVVLDRWLAALTLRGLTRTITLGQGAAHVSLTDEGVATVLRCMGNA